VTSHLQAELRATCTAWTAWAVALRWVNLAATVCDGKPSELRHVTAKFVPGFLVCLYFGFVFVFVLLLPNVSDRLCCFALVPDRFLLKLCQAVQIRKSCRLLPLSGPTQAADHTSFQVWVDTQAPGPF